MQIKQFTMRQIIGVVSCQAVGLLIFLMASSAFAGYLLPGFSVDVGFLAVKPSPSSHDALVDNDSGFSSPSDQDNYRFKTSTSAPGLHLGISKTVKESRLQQVDVVLSYDRWAAAHYKGDVLLFSLPSFDNYLARVDAMSQTLQIGARVYWRRQAQYQPMVLFNIGGVFNHVDKYYEEPRPGVTARVSPGYGGGNEVNLSYGLGAGLKWKIANDVSLNVAYLFQYLGSTHSGNGQGTWAEQRLNLGDLKRHGLTGWVSF